MDVGVRRVAAGETIQKGGDRAEALFLVQKGFLYSHDTSRTGRRQIAALHLPGEVAGLNNLQGPVATQSMRAAEDSLLTVIPNPMLADSARMAPELAAELLLLAARENASLARALFVVGRMVARDRMVWLLLTLHDRQTVRPGGADTALWLPLTQTEIGDVLGLTNVSISKILSQLAEEGAIARHGAEVHLLRREALARQIGYIDPPGAAPLPLRIEPVLLPLRVRVARTPTPRLAVTTAV